MGAIADTVLGGVAGIERGISNVGRGLGNAAATTAGWDKYNQLLMSIQTFSSVENAGQKVVEADFKALAKLARIINNSYSEKKISGLMRRYQASPTQLQNMINRFCVMFVRDVEEFINAFNQIVTTLENQAKSADDLDQKFLSEISDELEQIVLQARDHRFTVPVSYGQKFKSDVSMLLNQIERHYRHLEARQNAGLNYSRNEKRLSKTQLFWLGPFMSFKTFSGMKRLVGFLSNTGFSRTINHLTQMKTMIREGKVSISFLSLLQNVLKDYRQCEKAADTIREDIELVINTVIEMMNNVEVIIQVCNEILKNEKDARFIQVEFAKVHQLKYRVQNDLIGDNNRAEQILRTVVIARHAIPAHIQEIIDSSRTIIRSIETGTSNLPPPAYPPYGG